MIDIPVLVIMECPTLLLKQEDGYTFEITEVNEILNQKL